MSTIPLRPRPSLSLPLPRPLPGFAPSLATTVARAPRADRWICLGSAEYRRANAAMFLAGFASFSLIYCVQPLLHTFTESFGVSPAQSALALSLTTGLLAVAIVLASAASQALGRRGLMFASMGLASLLNLAAALAPGWGTLLAARALEGLVLGGVPAVAMTWLAEEIDPKDLGRTMGLYIAGTAFGAMAGRVGIGMLTEFLSWRIALGALGTACLFSALSFFALLPRSRNFERRPGFDLHFHLAAWGGHLRNDALLRLYATGFLLSGIFVAPFNYTTFRLAQAPFGFGPTAVSLLFLVFGFGMIASPVAGGLMDRLGRRPVLLGGFLISLAGLGLTLLGSLAAIVAGVALMTIGFFVGHSAASGAVGRLATTARGHATSLYLFFYYMGASVVGFGGGFAWQAGGWGAVVALGVALATTGAVLSATTRVAR
ncbi:MAG: MFS transporter [Rhodovulum sulfidophilum]|uniref:MFS transporter n=1 Tax=Rhodovulum sulfidophilum TaxID=35806 RepID=A0A2W5MZP0_RHOSU|nr:MAG: MFS transporter [Rhodovulum sulfidophilum]